MNAIANLFRVINELHPMFIHKQEQHMGLLSKISLQGMVGEEGVWVAGRRVGTCCLHSPSLLLLPHPSSLPLSPWMSMSPGHSCGLRSLLVEVRW